MHVPSSTIVLTSVTFKYSDFISFFQLSIWKLYGQTWCLPLQEKHLFIYRLVNLKHQKWSSFCTRPFGRRKSFFRRELPQRIFTAKTYLCFFQTPLERACHFHEWNLRQKDFLTLVFPGKDTSPIRSTYQNCTSLWAGSLRGNKGTKEKVLSLFLSPQTAVWQAKLFREKLSVKFKR